MASWRKGSMKFIWILLLLSANLFAHEEECRDSLPPSIQEILAIQPHIEWFAASDNNIRNSKCLKKTPFTDAEMKDWMAKDNGSQKVNRTVNGISFEGESPENLEAFQQLTTAIDFYGRREPSRQRRFNSACKNVQCAVDEIFGKGTGTQLLFMQRKFGMNGSHIASNNAKPWKQSELNDVMLSLNDFPASMLPTQKNRPLIRYAGTRPANFERAVADSHIRVYDSWAQQSPEKKRYTITHEIGHVIAGASTVDTSPLWKNMSGWQMRSRINNGKREVAAYSTAPQALISAYGASNHQEDMAESIAAYRYNPEKLKRASPQKYHLIQNVIFDGVEYTSENACQNPNQFSKRVQNYATQRALQWQPTNGELALIANACSDRALQRMAGGIDVYSKPYLDCYKESLQKQAKKFLQEGLPNHQYAAYMQPLLRNIDNIQIPRSKMDVLIQQAADVHRNNLRETVRTALTQNDNFKPDCNRQSLSSTYMRAEISHLQVERAKYMKQFENMAMVACTGINATKSVRRTLGLKFTEEEIEAQVQQLVK